MDSPFIKEVKSRLEQWNEELDWMDEEGLKKDVKKKYFFERIKELRKKHREVKGHLDRLKGSDDDEWNELKVRLDTALKEMTDNMDSTRKALDD